MTGSTILATRFASFFLADLSGNSPGKPLANRSDLIEQSARGRGLASAVQALIVLGNPSVFLWTGPLPMNLYGW
jgi:hypothetical protein